ncbi:MAG: NAD(P)-binding domain-containing protein [Bacteroidetes bacterium]|nr:NAD(P)-binding domain-containing protein [Bacteroidota bacterium]
MAKNHLNISFIGAGTIGTALGNIIAETETHRVRLLSIEEQVVNSINSEGINTRYFPTLHLHPSLKATCDTELISDSDIIFLAIPSVVLMDYVAGIRSHIPPGATLVNLAKGFGSEHKTIVHCLKESYPNPLCSMKGPSFAREIINRVPTGFTIGSADRAAGDKLSAVFQGTSIFIDRSDDIEGVEMLSILKNIYAICLGIVDAHFNSPNIRFLILTKAFNEMRKILLQFDGKEETIFNYCGYGDFTLTALNDLSRNRTLGLLIGKGFFTEHVSNELVLEGKVAVNVFYEEISKILDVRKEFPIIAELYKIFNTDYDVSAFVSKLLDF